MSFSTIFQIASQGMSAQRERLEVATANLANSNTTRTAEGGPYRRRDVVFEAVAVESPRSSFNAAFTTTFENIYGNNPQGVRASTLIAETDDNEGLRRYEPDHPDANAQGYIQLPDVDPLEETVNILSAARSFEANATAFNTVKEMARASLRLNEA